MVQAPCSFCPPVLSGRTLQIDASSLLLHVRVRSWQCVSHPKVR